MILAFRYLVWDKERQCERVIISHATWASPWQSYIFFLKLKVFRVKDLCVIINDDPEGLRFTIPPIVPVELGSDSQLYLEDCSSDGLCRDLRLQIRHITHKLIHLVLVCWSNITCSIVKFPLVQIVHTHSKLFQSIDNVVLNVAEASDSLVLIRQLSNGGAD